MQSDICHYVFKLILISMSEMEVETRELHCPFGDSSGRSPIVDDALKGILGHVTPQKFQNKRKAFCHLFKNWSYQKLSF